jgi:DNA-binding CsgD family transcriptional regulator
MHRLEEASGLLKARLAVTGPTAIDQNTPSCYLLPLLEAAVLVGEKEAAGRLQHWLRDAAHLTVALLALSCPARHLGAASEMLGNPEEARSYYEQAFDVARGVRFRPEMALARLQLGDLLLRYFPSERGPAREHVDLAISEFEAMGMTPALQRAVSLRDGQPLTGQASPAFPHGLSTREVEVLRLLAAGRSNAQIAEDLVISQNTVIRHVSNIFAKIGAANRAQAAVYAKDHGLA